MMLAQRITARRVLAPYSVISPPFALLAGSTHLRVVPSRPIATESLPAAGSTTTTTTSSPTTILASQRLHRPVSPHLLIYRPQITWYGSGLNRITGSVLSGAFYIFGFTYLVSPLLGWHLESAALAASFASLPLGLKVAFKALLAWPFTYHSLSGVKHLIWDCGIALSNRAVAMGGWLVVGASLLSAGVLAWI